MSHRYLASVSLTGIPHCFLYWCLIPVSDIVFSYLSLIFVSQYGISHQNIISVSDLVFSYRYLTSVSKLVISCRYRTPVPPSSQGARVPKASCNGFVVGRNIRFIFLCASKSFSIAQEDCAMSSGAHIFFTIWITSILHLPIKTIKTLTALTAPLRYHPFAAKNVCSLLKNHTTLTPSIGAFPLRRKIVLRS